MGIALAVKRGPTATTAPQPNGVSIFLSLRAISTWCADHAEIVFATGALNCSVAFSGASERENPLVEKSVQEADGMIYLPEIKYRRVLNRAFGPGGWGLAPRSQTHIGPKVVSREYALVCLGRLVGIARGEQEYFDPTGIPTATEACKSNALMRCCKDLGVASELWDPRFIREFKSKYCVEVFAEHLATKKKRKLWRRKDQPKFEYPFKE
ncbi:hypothetical protein EWM64_g4586 [Hericium alpestre]|uniref:Mitochondrial genome maintenance protein MGM101 n=1 Tax=Hericium alpestre TaxID=135208 RepID=A0A4Y9ZZC1_9AGAM|nr:hypothetical protein EWM64_g4586 [Hericium alpestre]